MSELIEAVRSHTWYHTIDLGNGVVTPGYYDLRRLVGSLPWPDVRGKRCLDVGTFDGFLAFELERRGAAEVVALDIDDYHTLDWPARVRDTAPVELERAAGTERGRGFRIAKEALGSNVQRLALNVYDLSPDVVGKFDVIVCGSILTHLRDPIRALERMREVCDGRLLATEGADLWLSIRHPRRPLLQLRGIQDQWYLTNLAGLRRMLHVAGFAIEKQSRRYALDMGAGYGGNSLRAILGLARRSGAGKVFRAMRRAALAKVLTGRWGPSHVAIVARPDL